MKKCFTFLLILFGLTVSSGLNAQTTITGDGTHTFSTPGNFDIEIPANCAADITYEIWGGGGGGGFINPANANTPLRAAPGGSGGGYSTGTIIGQAGGTYTLTVGTGGVVSNFATTKQNGLSSSVFGVTSGGGRGGGATNPGPGGTGDVVGGVGGLRNGNATSGIGGGGGGGSGSVVTNGADAVGSVGGTGGMPNGGSGSDAGGNGVNGIAPGGAGGGKGAGGTGLNGFTSGDGADGQITLVITNYNCIMISNDADINDPCACNLGVDGFADGTFSETVTASSLTGETWTVTAIAPLNPGGTAPTGISVGSTLTETPAGSGSYEITFNHTNVDGYQMTASNGSISLTIDNVCAVPTISFNPGAIAATYNDIDPSVALGAGLVNTIMEVQLQLDRQLLVLMEVLILSLNLLLHQLQPMR